MASLTKNKVTKGWFVYVLLERGGEGTKDNYPFKTWNTYTNKRGTVFYSFKIFRSSQQSKAQKVWDKYFGKMYPESMKEEKEHAKWLPIGGDMVEFEDNEELARLILHQYKKRVVF